MVDLYPYLILVGGSILAATAWLLYSARTQTWRSQELLRLNEQLEFDLPDFLRQCWPALSAGGFAGLAWRLDWFGTRLTGNAGTVTELIVQQRLEVPEISLEISLYHPRRGGEQRYFSRMLAENFFLLARMDMWIKLGTVQGTFEQTAKMTVFLQHDMKNLLQLISLAADQLAAPLPGNEDKLIATLQLAVPAVRDRARHILKALGTDRSQGRIQDRSLAEVLRESAGIYELEVSIDGDAVVSVSDEALHSIVDNLLGNYSLQSHDAASQTAAFVKIQLEKQATQVVALIEDEFGKPCLWPERLFEPFWSERGAGRGIGLYQARQLACAAGGNLEVLSLPDKPLRFILSLPLRM